MYKVRNRQKYAGTVVYIDSLDSIENIEDYYIYCVVSDHVYLLSQAYSTNLWFWETKIKRSTDCYQYFDNIDKAISYMLDIEYSEIFMCSESEFIEKLKGNI